MFEALTVLLVDDDVAIQTTLYRTLEDEGCSVLAAGSGTEALDICRQSRRPIDLMLTDVDMPGMSGFDLATHALILQPLMKILFMSGHADNGTAHAGGVLGVRPFLAKPFSRAALIHKLTLALGY
jgi:two-component system, cell cycle sensor histidine kinase and response regulator CckA